MPISPMVKFQRLLFNFETATRVHEMKGVHMPDDHEQIQKDYDEAKKKLEEFVFKLI